MSVSGVRKLHDHGPSSWSVTEPARRRIDPADVAYARGARAKGWGWQAIARNIGINEIDLRRAVEGLETVGAPALRAPMPPPPKPAKLQPEPRLPVKAGGVQARALEAIARGAVGRQALSEVLGGGVNSAASAFRDLRDKDLLTVDWSLTPRGEAVLTRLAVLAGRSAPARAPVQDGEHRVRPGTQYAGVLTAIAAGAASYDDLHERVPAAAGSLKVVVSQLRSRGLLDKRMGLTAAGAAEAGRLLRGER